jgi:hypothetical protein
MSGVFVERVEQSIFGAVSEQAAAWTGVGVVVGAGVGVGRGAGSGLLLEPELAPQPGSEETRRRASATEPAVTRPRDGEEERRGDG